jgi:osmotically-inducible protein OsmY
MTVLMISMSFFSNVASQATGGRGEATAESSRTDEDTKAADRELEKNVHRALGKTKKLSSVDIRVHAEAGVVTLAGTVPNQRQVDKAAHVAESVPDVTSVWNYL